ncbi:MAG: DUF6132 family protein [Ignavibacteria bacterium]|nr:DUF6132 family protein [Ignavibacteria bacterium]
MAIGTIIGGILGYLYYYFIGCNGGCPISSNWMISVLYGAFLGAIIATPTKRGTNGKNN